MTYIAEMPQTGDVITERYLLKRKLGQGSYGVVYQATDAVTSTEVAVKIIRPMAMDQHQILARFAREISVALKLKHAHTVRVFEQGVYGEETEVQGLPFLVMEYLDGQNLRQWLEDRPEGRVGFPHAMAVVLQVLSGLAEAHSYEIIHRDLKLENIFVAKDMETGAAFIKLLDFGTVKAVSSEEERLTQTDMVMGTPQIMAPEQITGQRDLSTSVDVYAVGCLVYHLLTGKPVFEGRTQLQVASQHLQSKPPPLPGDLERSPVGEVVRRALHKKSDERYTNAAELKAALEAALSTMGVEPVMPGADEIGELPDLLPMLPDAPAAEDPAATEVELASGGGSTTLWLALAGVALVVIVVAGYLILKG